MLLATSCHDDEVISETPDLPVTYASIAGTWSLESYCGSTLPEGAYMTLTFHRKEHTVEMEGNLSSSYPVTRTSSFSIEGDDYYGYTLSGSYGAVAGDWQYRYQVHLKADGTMFWEAVGQESVTHLYRRIGS